MGGIFKSISIVLFNLCFIGSFILAFKFEAGRWIIYGLIAGFISFLPIYILGEIAEQLEKNNKNTYELCELLREMKQREENKGELQGYYNPPAPKINRTSGGNWICNKCNTENEKNSLICKCCETYR